jgi:hypothetical protein
MKDRARNAMKSVISKHIKNILDTGELDPQRTVAKLATVQTEGGRSVTRENRIPPPGSDPRRRLPREIRRAARISANGQPPNWSSTWSKASPWTTNASSRPAASNRALTANSFASTRAAG